MTICSTTVTWHLPSELPAEAGSYLAMFKEDNELELSSEYPEQVDFDLCLNDPCQFTVSDGRVAYRVSDLILCWCELPTPPSVELLHR